MRVSLPGGRLFARSVRPRNGLWHIRVVGGSLLNGALACSVNFIIRKPETSLFMPVRTLLAAVALLAAPALASHSAVASPNDLMIVTRDESLQRAIQAAYVQPFTAVTGLPVQQDVWEGGIDTLRTQAKAPDNSWDLVLVDADELSTGCGEGLFEKLDWSAIGGKDHYQPQAVSDCGLGARCRHHRAGLGQGQAAGRAVLVGFLGCGEISRQARPAERRARQPGDSR